MYSRICTHVLTNCHLFDLKEFLLDQCLHHAVATKQQRQRFTDNRFSESIVSFGLQLICFRREKFEICFFTSEVNGSEAAGLPATTSCEKIDGLSTRALPLIAPPPTRRERTEDHATGHENSSGLHTQQFFCQIGDSRQSGDARCNNRDLTIDAPTAGQNAAEQFPGKDNRRSPDDRRQAIGNVKRSGSHLHHTGGNRNNRAQRAKKSANKNTCPSVSFKKTNPAQKHFGPCAKGPVPRNHGSKSLPDPKRNPISKDRTSTAREDGCHRIENARSNKSTRRNKNRRPRKYQPDERERFPKGRSTDDEHRPRRMRGN